jgi:hypothetical protein
VSKQDSIHAHKGFTFPVGPAYFGVTAVDTSGNESELSDIVECFVEAPQARGQVGDTFIFGMTIEEEEGS